jgi:putative transcriptional regulator
MTFCNIYLTFCKLYVILVSMNEPARMNLKLARIEKNLTQQELADIVGVTRQTIGLIEKGTYNPTLKLCINISKALDRTLDQLFWEDEKDE